MLTDIRKEFGRFFSKFLLLKFEIIYSSQLKIIFFFFVKIFQQIDSSGAIC